VVGESDEEHLLLLEGTRQPVVAFDLDDARPLLVLPLLVTRVPPG
jgi:hypothetical protein